VITARIVVLNYDGKAFLGETLPTLEEAARRSRYACGVTVIDNSSRDGSAEFVAERFPSIELVRRPNRVLCSYNDVLKDVEESHVILLNNDLRVDPDFVNPLLEPFEDAPDLFLVAPRVMDYAGAARTGGRNRAWLSWGLFKVDEVPACDLPRPARTFGAGCAGAYDRRKFLALGGYDTMYLPGTMEDIDLCWRAWRKGQTCLYQPSSVVYHKGQESFHRRFGARRTAAINARNVYLFMWKNIDDPRIWFEHAALLLPRFAWSVLRGQPYWVTGFFRALAKAGEVSERRAALRNHPRALGDRAILALFEGRG
jgi:N-acetylglucosaminyl-diphospho-decaprenol L-rhamnosyltransferase